MGNSVCVKSHTSLADRIAVAQQELIEKRGCTVPVLVDSMENEFNLAFDAWPERFFILEPRPVEKYPDALIFGHISNPSLEDRGFDRSEIHHYLTVKRIQLAQAQAGAVVPV